MCRENQHVLMLDICLKVSLKTLVAAVGNLTEYGRHYTHS